jgi:hypothetical protein
MCELTYPPMYYLTLFPFISGGDSGEILQAICSGDVMYYQITVIEMTCPLNLPILSPGTHLATLCLDCLVLLP